MAALDEDPVKKILLRSIIKGNATKVAEILKKNPKLSADETHGDPCSRVSGKCIIVVRSFYSMKGFQLPCTACLLILHLEF